MSKVFQGCSSFFAVLLQAWLASYTVAQPALTPCVSATPSANPYATSRLINIMYVPANSTTMVLDADGKFVFFDATGAPYYSETIPLPMMTMYPTRKAKVVCAMFGSPEVYLVLSDGQGFTYQAGVLINPVTLHAGEYTRGEGFVLTPKDDVCIRYLGSEMRLYQFNPTTKTVVYLPPYSDPAILDSKASSRVHWNKEFGGFSMIIQAKNIWTAKVVGTAPNYQIVSDSAVGTYLLTIPSTSDMVLSNVGISPTRLIVNTIEGIPTVPGRVKTLIYGYDYTDLVNPAFYMDDIDKMVYNIAWCSSTNDFVGVTTEGQFVLVAFDMIYVYGPLDSNNHRIWVHPTLAETVILAPNIAAHITQETLQIQEIGTTYLTKTLIKRPTYAVNIPGTSQAVLVYQNLEARMFDTATETEAATVFGDPTRQLRKLIRGDVSGNYYAMYEESIAVLSPTGTILSETTVVTVSNTAFGNTQVDSFKDFDVLEAQGHIFTFFKTSDSLWAYSVILDLNLAVLAKSSNQNDGGDYTVITLAIFPGPTLNQMYVAMKGPDDLHVNMYDVTMDPATDNNVVVAFRRPSSEFPFAAWGPSYANLRHPFFLESSSMRYFDAGASKQYLVTITPRATVVATIETTTLSLEFSFFLAESHNPWTSGMNPVGASVTPQGQIVFVTSEAVTAATAFAPSVREVFLSNNLGQGALYLPPAADQWRITRGKIAGSQSIKHSACSECSAGFYFVSASTNSPDLCQTCGSSCLTCAITPNQCTGCSPGYNLDVPTYRCIPAPVSPAPTPQTPTPTNSTVGGGSQQGSNSTSATPLNNAGTQIGSVAAPFVSASPVSDPVVMGIIESLLALDPSGMLTKFSQFIRLFSRLYFLNIEKGDILEGFLDSLEKYAATLTQPRNLEYYKQHRMGRRGRLTDKGVIIHFPLELHWKIVLYLVFTVGKYSVYWIASEVKPKLGRLGLYVMYYIPRLQLIAFNLALPEICFYGISGFLRNKIALELALTGLIWGFMILDVLERIWTIFDTSLTWDNVVLLGLISEPLARIDLLESQERRNSTTQTNLLQKKPDKTKQNNPRGPRSFSSELDYRRIYKNIGARLDLRFELLGLIKQDSAVFMNPIARLIGLVHLSRVLLYETIICATQSMAHAGVFLLWMFEVMVAITIFYGQLKHQVFRNRSLFGLVVLQTLLLLSLHVVLILPSCFGDKSTPDKLNMQYVGMFIILFALCNEYFLILAYLLAKTFAFIQKTSPRIDDRADISLRLGWFFSFKTSEQNQSPLVSTKRAKEAFPHIVSANHGVPRASGPVKRKSKALNINLVSFRSVSPGNWKTRLSPRTQAPPKHRDVIFSLSNKRQSVAGGVRV